MAGFYKSFFKVSMIFCVVLCFYALGEQEGFCVDCVKGGQAKGEIQALSKLTCRIQVNKPECKNVPEIMRKDCDNLRPLVQDRYLSNLCVPISWAAVGSALFSGMMIFSEGTNKGTSSVRSLSQLEKTFITRGINSYYLHLYNGNILEVQREAKQRGLDPKDVEGIKKQARQETTYSIGKRLYNRIYGDLHCYNEVTQPVRVCGLMAGLGASTGSEALLGASGGLMAGGVAPVVPIFSLENEYKKIQHDIQSKLRVAKDNAHPSVIETLDTLLNEASQ